VCRVRAGGFFFVSADEGAFNRERSVDWCRQAATFWSFFDAFESAECRSTTALKGSPP
jgi:hypothetical protein